MPLLAVVAGAARSGQAQELPTPHWTFSVDSVYSSGGLYNGHLGFQWLGRGGLADGNIAQRGSVWGNASFAEGSNPFIAADFGEVIEVSNVYIHHVVGALGWGAQYTNAALMEYSADGVSWTTITTTSGHLDSDATPKQYSMGALMGGPIMARFIRLSKVGPAWLAVGEFYFD